ncbi:MAG: DUF2079 domain-containing protein, partial [Acidimicrobiales bacterium]
MTFTRLIGKRLDITTFHAKWLGIFWVLAGVISTVGMITHSASLFSHFELTPDFANFYQATWLIAHGHLYPYDTLFPFNYPHYGFPYLDSHAEFFTWLLAPFVAIVPNGFVLLVLQDLAIGASQVIAALWIHHLLRRFNPLIEVAAVGIFVFLNPWYYFSAFFDFHLEPFAMLFLLLTAWSYLNGRRRFTLIFALLVLSTGDVPSTYLVGLGPGMYLLDRSRNRSALLIALVGAINALVDSIFHLSEASSVLQRYSYLAGPHGATSLGGLLAGVLTHPRILIATLSHHLPLALPYLLSGNLLGLLGPLGFFVTVPILGGPLLVQSSLFLSNFTAFQIVALEPLLAISGIGVYLWSKGQARRVWAIAATVGLFVSLGEALATSYPSLVAAKDFNNTVSSSTAHTLNGILHSVPTSAEVISGNGTVGRFSDRRLVYSLITFQSASVPIWSHFTYVIVVAGQGIADPSPTEASVIARFLTHDHLHTEIILHQGAVSVFLIHST